MHMHVQRTRTISTHIMQHINTHKCAHSYTKNQERERDREETSTYRTEVGSENLIGIFGVLFLLILS